MSSVADFLARVSNTCSSAGVELRLVPEKSVYTPGSASPCAGYFIDDEQLAVAVCRPDWPGILAHEFGHLEQSLEGLFQFPNGSPYEVLEKWLSGKKVAEKRLQKAVGEIMACEHDAECRAVGYISSYGLSNDLGGYIARANGYVYSYLYAIKNRKWPRLNGWDSIVPRDRLLALNEYMLTPHISQVISTAHQSYLLENSLRSEAELIELIHLTK